MFYEFRTYTLRPTTLPEVLKRFGDAYPVRRKYSELAAFFYTEIGPLNQIIHIWPYADLAERARVRVESRKDPGWPAKIHEFIVKQETELYVPFPFSPELKPGKLGPIFEMRSYIVKPGDGIKKTMERWEKKLPERTAISPLAFVGHTEFGPLNKYVHIWPYPSLDERARIRKLAVDKGAWPPPGGGETLVSQENKICLPAPFSPLQ
jgi:NIPSNAP